MTPEEIKFAEACYYAEERYGCDVLDLGWEDEVHAAIANGEDFHIVIQDLGEKYDLTPLQSWS